MHPKYFQIAATKTTDPVAIAMLNRLERYVQDLATAEALFPERINVNKVKRGEKPNKLSRSREEQLKGFEQDAKDIESKLCQDFSQNETPSQIVWALHFALTNDLPNAQKFLKYYHPDDVPLGAEIVDIKTQLHQKMTEFLAAYPHS